MYNLAHDNAYGQEKRRPEPQGFQQNSTKLWHLVALQIPSSSDKFCNVCNCLKTNWQKCLRAVRNFCWCSWSCTYLQKSSYVFLALLGTQKRTGKAFMHKFFKLFQIHYGKFAITLNHHWQKCLKASHNFLSYLCLRKFWLNFDIFWIILIWRTGVYWSASASWRLMTSPKTDPGKVPKRWQNANKMQKHCKEEP